MCLFVILVRQSLVTKELLYFIKQHRLLKYLYVIFDSKERVGQCI